MFLILRAQFIFILCRMTWTQHYSSEISHVLHKTCWHTVLTLLQSTVSASLTLPPFSSYNQPECAKQANHVTQTWTPKYNLQAGKCCPFTIMLAVTVILNADKQEPQVNLIIKLWCVAFINKLFSRHWLPKLFTFQALYHYQQQVHSVAFLQEKPI